MSDTFAITRADGRSNAQVVCDLVCGAEPGTTFTYDEIIASLSDGSETTYTVDTARQAVYTACLRLLREHSRTLHNIRGVGFRLACASDHRRLAGDRKRRADKQMFIGLKTLQHVKWSELDPAAKAAHEGTLLLVAALYENQRSLEARMSRVENAINASRVIGADTE
jgi:hypothetical protein